MDRVGSSEAATPKDPQSKLGSMNKVGIIGFGRAGSVLAYLLAEKGYTVKIVRSKPVDGSELQVKEHRFAVLSLADVAREAEMLFIATPDRVIGEVAHKLARLDVFGARAVLHLSGSLPPDILQPLQDKGVATGSLHPLQSLARLEQALQSLPGSTLTFQGDPALLPWVTALAESLGCRLVVVPAGFDRRLYHAGASIVSNFLVTLAKAGVDCLVQSGLSPAEAQQGLVALMQGTLTNLAELPPEQALTGPIARGDLATVESHLAALEQLPHLLPAYEALGRLTADLALAAGRLARTEYRSIVENLAKGDSEHGEDDGSDPEGKKEAPGKNHHGHRL